MRTFTTLAIGLLFSLPGLTAAEPYVSAQLGYANAEWSRGAPLNGAIDDRGAAYGVDAGFSFRRHWAVEVGAYGYESLDARGTPCAPGEVCTGVVTEFGGNDISILKVALVPTFTVGATRLFATLGYYRADIDANLALPDTESHDNGAVVGVGARWYFRDPWSVSVQAVRFDDNLQQLMFGVGWGLRRERDESESN